MNQKRPNYKPLLFTTTVRNPKRIKGFLNILSKFNGKILTDDLAEEIMGEIIKYGLYRPSIATKEIIEKWGSKRISDNSLIGEKLLSNEEVKQLLLENPQQHKEAGFKKGWSSRFATEFDFAKELGFVYFLINEKIKFSEIGLKLANSINIKVNQGYLEALDAHPEFEQQAFLHSLVKYHRNNPFVRVANDNAPLILLLEVIQKLNSDEDFNSVGISKIELPLLIFWKNKDSNELYTLIKSLRKKYGFKPSSEIIVDICVNKIMEGNFKKFKSKSIVSDYPDEFIRKMRLTGLISLRGGGRFIDINHNEQKKVDYILKNYSNYKKFSNEKEYFNYMSRTDEKLISLESKTISVEENNKYLEKWVDLFAWKKIKEELMILAKKRLSEDGILKFLPSPVRLEFLVSLAIKCKLPHIKVVPNYPCDDEGIPTSTAAGNGNKGDIECFEKNKGILIEVTMSEGRIQTMMEVWPIVRHLEEFLKNTEHAMCYFIAPSIFNDSERQIKFVKENENLDIIPKTIEQFLIFIENNNSLYAII